MVDARQYTVPVPEALEAVRSGANPELTTRQKHTRECFVVAEEGADTAAIEEAIVTMPNYFADYDTTVTFISQEELDRDHAGIPHGGSVIRTGTTGAAGENTHVIEYSLKLDSNPEFTGSVLVACARACWRMACAGETGCRDVYKRQLYFHLWKAAGISVTAAPWMAAVGAALVCYGMPVLIMAVLSRLGKAGIIVYPARYLPPAPATMLRKTPH